jgi:large subunit ribosomal protein L6
MSRVGKNPVPVPGNVEVTLSASEVSVKGPLGTLKRRLVSDISVEQDGGKLIVKAANDSKQANAMSGTMRALLANMVKGVTNGFEKKLTLVGVGYRAQAAGDVLNLTLGFSHPVA